MILNGVAHGRAAIALASSLLVGHREASTKVGRGGSPVLLLPSAPNLSDSSPREPVPTLALAVRGEGEVGTVHRPPGTLASNRGLVLTLPRAARGRGARQTGAPRTIHLLDASARHVCEGRSLVSRILPFDPSAAKREGDGRD